jgi:hypothetical protein
MSRFQHHNGCILTTICETFCTFIQRNRLGEKGRRLCDLHYTAKMIYYREGHNGGDSALPGVLGGAQHAEWP